MSYYKDSNSLNTMLKIIEPVLFAFLRGSAIKKLALDIVRAMVKKTDNTVSQQSFVGKFLSSVKQKMYGKRKF